MARIPAGSLKNKNGEYKWWFVLWRLPNVFFEGRGSFLGGRRDELIERLVQVRALLGVGALIYIANAYPGYLSGVQAAYQTSGRLWPGVGTALRFAEAWETSIVTSIILSAAWIALFAVLLIPIARLRALPGLLLHLCWPVATIALFAGQFFLIGEAILRTNNYVNSVGTPNFGASIAMLAGLFVGGVWVIKVIYLAATDVFRGDDAHPLLAPFVTTGVSWTLAYLALSSGAQSGLPYGIRLLTTLLGPLTVTGINVWACWRIRDENHGDLLFLDGPPASSRYRLVTPRGAGGLSRREILRLAVPPAIVIGASPWWAPKALALATTWSNQIVNDLNGTGTTVNLQVTEAVVTSVAFSPDGRTLASGTTYGTVQFWDVANPARPAALGHGLRAQDEVISVAFSPDGRTLASGSTDATIQLWDLAVPARPAALGHLLETPHQVSSVAFSPNGRILAASGNDGGNFYGEGSGTIQLWDAADRARPTALGRSGVLAEGYSAVVFSPHGRMLASGSMHSVVQLWDVADPSRPTVLCSLRTSAIYGYTFVAFRPDGRILAGGNGVGVISLWNVANPARPVVLGQPLAIPDENPVSSLAFSPDGRTLIGSSNRGFSNLGPWDGPGGIYSWDVSDPARPKGPTPFATVPVPGFSAAAFSPDGRTLASGGDGGSNGNGPGTVQLWDVANPARPTALGRPLS